MSTASLGGSNPHPTWTATFTVQSVHLTLLVRDQRGGISAVRLTITVTPPGQVVGAATVRVTFNSLLLVSNVVANERRLVFGQSTLLTANVVDPDGGAVTCRWTATCAGNFSAPNALTSIFTPTALPAGPCNNCLVMMTASDPLGGVRSASVNLCVVPTALP
ncbi:hypothetical protein [Myxococcus eversor]|uniref:hypothetical protein n=1 Tax=Myxococcus eversor TaxID=2709661 RepID=UPI0013D7E70C|nr:hypothetical protein [Myxococcus eversor]